MNVIIELIEQLLSMEEPDMERSDDALTIRRPCSSANAVSGVLPDDCVVGLCRAHEGNPLWPESVRSFAIGWYAGRITG